LELAKQRQLKGEALPENSGKGEALDIVGSNKETVRQALYLIEHAQPEEITTRNPRSMPRPSEISGLNP
jgi:hypothetical protein